MSEDNALSGSGRERVVAVTNSVVFPIAEGLKNTRKLLRGERLGQIGIVILIGFIFLGLFGPMLAPYEPAEDHRDADGSVLRLAEPSGDHWFGTNHLGRDIFTQWLYGARVTLIVGAVGALVATFIGANIGLWGAYYGGRLDDLLMRLTDLTYGLPFLPTVIVLVFIIGTDLINIILVIALILWRGPARVIRSEVLSLRERPYLDPVRVAGASNLRIMYRHIFPNILPLVVLYLAITVAAAVLGEASIAFLGFGDPGQYTWGRMLHEAYNAGAIRHAWWWVIPPGIGVMFFVMSVFFIGRTLEKVTNPEIEQGGGF